MAKDVSSAETKVEEKKQKKKEKNVIPTKLVIRRLPPFLTENELLEIIGPFPPHDYFRYVKGDDSLAPENFCRAYINLTSPDDILAFRDKVDGLEFTDSKGNTQACILEYAPYPKNPRKVKKREDSKVGTIEEDADYKAFLESLEAEEEKVVIDLEKFLEELEKKEQKNKHVETPLTAFLKQKREERRRQREERRKIEQEKRKKREERRRRDSERKKKLDLEKQKKKKEQEDKKMLKKENGANDSKEGLKEDGDESKASNSDKKTEVQAKGDAKLSSKGKFEPDRPKSSHRFSESKSKKDESKDPVRRGPIGSKPKDTADEEDRGKGYSDRYKEGRGGYGGRGGSRGRGYRAQSSREYPRKWDKSDDTPPRARGKSWGEDPDKRGEKPKAKRPDREIYRPGSGRGRSGAEGGATSGGSRPHKYSEQRNRKLEEN